MDLKKYDEYMQSDDWRVRRWAYLNGHKNCEICGEHLGRFAQVHHKTYAHFGAEPDEDLQALCRRCHAIEEAKKGNPIWLGFSIIAESNRIPPPKRQDVIQSESDAHQLSGDSYELYDPPLGDDTAEVDRHGFYEKPSKQPLPKVKTKIDLTEQIHLREEARRQKAALVARYGDLKCFASSQQEARPATARKSGA